ncbi:hypothetical protein KC19_VG187500 [Ceratodon purpureus]|uniref:Uncharacterized protein n=1 Tax=Ceratodon purpureus TaxID=3225 RepID=A0A8T0HRD5_CERPU|nr:hypothetical protein KC19_VG187500 [Ceratodon purpureus]
MHSQVEIKFLDYVFFFQELKEFVCTTRPIPICRKSPSVNSDSAYTQRAAFYVIAWNHTCKVRATRSKFSSTETQADRHVACVMATWRRNLEAECITSDFCRPSLPSTPCANSGQWSTHKISLPPGSPTINDCISKTALASPSSPSRGGILSSMYLHITWVQKSGRKWSSTHPGQPS